MAQVAPLKQLTIKTNIVKRLTRETVSHKKEADMQKNRIENVKNAGGDIHVIQKQEEVLAECLMMIPECRQRLQIAVEELTEFLNNEPDIEQSTQFENAKAILVEAELVLD